MSEFSRGNPDHIPENRWAFAALRDPQFLEDLGVTPRKKTPDHPLGEQIKKGTQQLSGKLRQILSS